MAKHNRKQTRKITRKVIESEVNARAKARKYAKLSGGEVRLPPKLEKRAFGSNHRCSFADALEQALS